MKKYVLAALLSLATVAPVFADGTNAPAFPDDKTKVSYAIGMTFGKGWKQNDIEINDDAFMQGLRDGRSGDTKLTEAEMKQVLADFQKELGVKQQKKHAEQAIKNKADGEAFLATNKNNPGVLSLTNGVQYKVITDGTGAIPAPNDIVKVNYRGTLLDGTEFDSSYKRGQPTQFPVNGVIKGWTSALEQMKVGSKWQLFIPGDLAYGERGRPGIPPNALLIFEVELIDSHAPPAAAPSPTSPPLTSDIIKVPSAEEMKKGAKIETIKPEDVQKAQDQK